MNATMCIFNWLFSVIHFTMLIGNNDAGFVCVNFFCFSMPYLLNRTIDSMIYYNCYKHTLMKTDSRRISIDTTMRLIRANWQCAICTVTLVVACTLLPAHSCHMRAQPSKVFLYLEETKNTNENGYIFYRAIFSLNMKRNRLKQQKNDTWFQ